MKPEHVNIDFVQEDDVDSVIKLVQVHMPLPSFDVPFWNWKFGENTTGRLPLALVVRYGDSIIGFLSFFPFQFNAGEHDLMGWQIADVVIHKSFRRRGLFKRMLNHALEILDGGLADFSLCFPSQDAYNGYMKFHYKDLGVVPYYVFFPDIKGYLSGRLRVPLNCELPGFNRPRLFSEYYMNHSTCEVREVTAFPRRLQIMPQHQAAHVMMKRDPQYLKWRYSHHPWHKYRVFAATENGNHLGYAIVRGCNIIDIWAPMINSFRSLLAAVLDEYLTMKVVMVHLYLQCTSEQRHVLQEAGFVRYRLPIRVAGAYRPQRLMIRCNPNRSCDETIVDLSRYYFTTGDVALGL